MKLCNAILPLKDISIWISQYYPEYLRLFALILNFRMNSIKLHLVIELFFYLTSSILVLFFLFLFPLSFLLFYTENWGIHSFLSSKVHIESKLACTKLNLAWTSVISLYFLYICSYSSIFFARIKKVFRKCKLGYFTLVTKALFTIPENFSNFYYSLQNIVHLPCSFLFKFFLLYFFFTKDTLAI